MYIIIIIIKGKEATYLRKCGGEGVRERGQKGTRVKKEKGE